MPTWATCKQPIVDLHCERIVRHPVLSGSPRAISDRIMKQPFTVHLIVGGYPPGSPAAHDMDYARLRLLHELAAFDDRCTTVSSDYSDLDRWLAPARLL